jgi:hypothetical protein
MPETVEAARRRVADAELAAEHAEQLKLAGLNAPPADRDRPARSACAPRSAISASTPCAWAWCPSQGPRRGGGLDAATFPGLAPDEIAKTVGLASRLTGV